MMDEARELTAEMPSSEDLAALYRRYQPGLERLARGLTGDPFLSQDLAHEAFIRATGRFGHIRGDFEGYLRTTLVNLVRSHQRRTLTERRWLARQDRREPSQPPTAPEGDEALLEALRRLPFRQRAAIVLRYLDDLSEERTASALRCSPRAVNGLVSRGLSTLREELGRPS